MATLQEREAAAFLDGGEAWHDGVPPNVWQVGAALGPQRRITLGVTAFSSVLHEHNALSLGVWLLAALGITPDEAAELMRNATGGGS